VSGNLVGKIVLLAVAHPQAKRAVWPGIKEHNFGHAELRLLAIQFSLDLPWLFELHAEMRPFILDSGGHLFLPPQFVNFRLATLPSPL
jgi:hypothetical protein